VAESGLVEFAQEDLLPRVGFESFGEGRVGDVAVDDLIDAVIDIGKPSGLADLYVVVHIREVFEEQPQPAEIGQVQPVGIFKESRQREITVSVVRVMFSLYGSSV
jgi:hypothetical protein